MKTAANGIALSLTLVLASSLTASPARAQSLGSRIDAVRDGRVRMTFAARTGVCGNGNSWYRSRDGGRAGQFNGMWNGGHDVDNTCEHGPVRVVVVREGGDTKEIRTYVGGRWRADTGSTDLGAVSAVTAGGWLLQQAERGAVRPAHGALTAAALADSVNPATTLLRIAKDDSRSQDMKSSAVNWLGEVVGDRVSSSLDSIAYEPGDRELRRTAINAISRRPADEAVPALIKMAESLPDKELRRAAVQALARNKDPRAMAWIERRVGTP
ncbi:HEAT repeat domain-containing protein [Gemmatimonas sp.]|uniref:HEAT repeat domain-containing protein n=1 Tax=Gemmatimonas sp. TaxID=1962908 RepID=UPI003983C143